MRWVIPVSELARLVKELRRDGMDYVELTLLEGDPPPAADPSPSCISFHGIQKSDPDFSVDYEEIDVVSGFDGSGPFLVRSRF